MGNPSGNMRPTSRWPWVSIFRGLIIAGLILLGLWSISWLARPASNLPSRDASVAAVTGILTPPLQTAPPAATPTWSGQVLEATAIAIAYTLPTLSPNPRSEPTRDADERTTQLWRVAIATAFALYPPPTPIEYPELFTPIAHPPWPTAIVHKRATSKGLIYDDPFIGPPCGFILDSNHWYGTAVGESTHVCAGADSDVPRKGAIVVEIWYSGDEKPTYRGKYWTPTDQGAVRIQDVVDDQVILASASNTIFQFDLATLRWVSPAPGLSPSPSALVSPIPSISPLPH